MKPAAVVTGGSGGVGRAVIETLAGRGWDTVSLSRREGTDVSDEAQVKKAFGRLERLDALVHCAAVLVKAELRELTAADWDAQVDSSLRGAFLCSREAFLRMKPGGSIVLVSSLSGVQGAEKFPGMAAYVAAKSGLAGLTGIRVNAVSPGAVDTEMLKIAGVEGPRLQPAAVAGIIAWLCSPESSPLSGANLRLDPSDSAA